MDFDQAMLDLRKSRQQAFAEIRRRAIEAHCELDETLQALSDFADQACRRAIEIGEAELIPRYGRPQTEAGGAARLIVLGMGKLGGRELNYSSDIDLIFLHSAEGETDGPESIDNSVYFKKLAQLAIKLLAEVTADGFVFRVDTMLRPFGSAGPLSMSVEAAERYYETHGREWERYALVKARPVAGDLQAGNDFLELIEPFVYRRYLDFNTIVSLRDLKKRIHDDYVARRGRDDVKLGPGGIRELEFIVQSFQLVRGGQDPRLRNPSLRETLRYLGDCELLSLETANKLDDCYVFLRKLENAIQMYQDKQTHRLPESEDARRFVAKGLALDQWAQVSQRFEEVSTFVHAEFDRVFAEPQGASRKSPCDAPVELSLAAKPDAAAVAAALEALDFSGETQPLAQHLIDLSQGHLVQGLSEAALARFRHMLGLLLEECLQAESPTRSAESVLKVIDAVAGRSTYLTLLDESAVVRAHLVRLCSASRWLTQQIASSPGTLDALLDPRTLYAPPEQADMATELEQQMLEIPVEDVENGMDVLRRYRNEVTVRIAAAEIAGELPVVKVSDHLTWLAEAVLESAMQRATRELESTHGRVLREDGSPAELAAIAYGKFGGIELGYGSDLDLVFVHDNMDSLSDSQGGERSLPAPAWFARLVQRVLHRLNTLTPAGRAYEVDLELRPNGSSGAVVVSFEAFARYQKEKAWTWEHQALTRARGVCGPERVLDDFTALRKEILQRQRDDAALRQEVASMRKRMRDHNEQQREGLWDVKQGRGGIIDCEFLVQYLLLRDAHDHPELTQWSDNWRQLDALVDAGSLDPADREGLIAHYRAYRRFAHACALQDQALLAPEGQFAVEQQEVIRVWTRLFGEEDGGAND